LRSQNGSFNLRSVDFEHANLDLAADETLFGQSTGDWRHAIKTRGYADESPYTIGFRWLVE